MPVVRFEIAELERLLEKDVPREDLARLIPMLGADVDDVSGDTWAIEFFPDRPDLFTVEGIARALRAYLGVSPGLASYEVGLGTHEVRVEASVLDVRPHIAGAYVRGVPVTQARLDALIDLQEDLHWGLGVRRRRVAIGLHDAAPLAPPFTYAAVAKDAVSFVPLAETASMTPTDILENHPKGREYAHLLAMHDAVPLITDSEGGVVSMPPIINAARTTVEPGTRDLFVDVTGTDEWAVGRALHILVTALAEAGGRIESVIVVGPDGARRQSPDLSPERRELSVEEVNRLLGLELDASGIAHRLRKMGHGATATDKNVVVVEVPSYRTDVLHGWDLIEDVAIGHGVDNFEALPPLAHTTGAALAENRRSEMARDALVGLGFLEAMGLTLSNARDQFERMQRVATEVVRVKNPVTEDHTLLRPSLLPGLLHVLKRNAHRDLPQRLFEVGMVARIKNGEPAFERHVAGVIVAGRSNFSEMKGVALALAQDLGWEPKVAKAEDASFLTGRAARFEGVDGVFGEVSPAVLEGFGLAHPVTAFEFRFADGPGLHVRGAR